jgi:cellulose synthase/poly-beta-1,6-N-acetylglucosamine synthase-like glycosyltransferase
MKKSFVSIVIPVRKINRYIYDENLPAFTTQTYKNFEVIVLPNTVSEKDKKLLKQYPWLRIIPTGKISRPAEKRDIGAEAAKGDILAFIDDDAYPSANWLEKAMFFFDKKKTAAICGPGIIPINTGIWEKIFDEILKSPIGSGGYQYRFVQKKARYIDDYPSMNFLIKKEVFHKLGGFNSEYWPGEDSKLCEDLVYKYNGKIYYHPDILVYHHRRTTLAGYLKQHANYGFHRGAFFAHGDRNSRRLSYLIPTFFVLYLILLLFALMQTAHYQLLVTPLFAYLALGIYLIISSFLHSTNSILALLTFPVLFLTHVVYGTMFIKGFIVGLIKNKKIYE